MADITNKNTSINGEKNYDDIKKTSVKNFYLNGGSSDDHVTLANLHNYSEFGKANPNIRYDGGAGIDQLSYSGDVRKVTLTYAGDSSSYEFYLEGGYGKGHGNWGFDSLDTHTNDVEIFRLTRDGDVVDLRDSPITAVVYGASGNDTMRGSSHADIFHGGDDADLIDGGAGEDTLDGGDGKDVIFGGEGNDVIIATDGQDTVSGGSGNDVIHAQAQMGDGEGVTYLYGDWVHNGDITANVLSFAQASGTYNQADVFMIGYSTKYEVVAQEAGTGGDTWGNLLDQSVGGAIGATGFGSLAQGGLSIGYSLVKDDLKNMIGIGADADSGIKTNSSKTHEVIVKDFDAWADIAVVSLDEHASAVTAASTANGDNQYAVQLSFGGLNLVQLALAQSQLSYMEGETVYPDLTNNLAAQIAQNLLNNSIKITTDSNGNVSVQTYSGVPLELSAADASDLAGTIGSSNEGVWIFGDYGNSILYGHDMALAGTNSDNLMYSGEYATSNSGTVVDVDAAISDTAATMIGGRGDDIIFGSEASGDKLYGGADNDILITGGASDLGIDYLYGGSGDDIASFETLYLTDAMTDADVFGGYSTTDSVTAETTHHGVFVDMGAGDAFVMTQDQWNATWSAFSNGDYDALNNLTSGTNYGNQIAELNSIEGIIGSDELDFLLGSDANDTIYGGAGNDAVLGGAGDDYIVGGTGWDLHFGGAGYDTFVFQGVATTGEKQWWERIYDFDVAEDQIRLDNTFDTSFGRLSISDHNSTGNTIVNYGDGSLYIYGVTADELTSAHFDFA
ncbi:MAG: hypothetical protein JXR13_13110 [Thalassovita sp.]